MTNPKRGYWGAAVVLDVGVVAGRRRCLIGVTRVVKQRPLTAADFSTPFEIGRMGEGRWDIVSYDCEAGFEAEVVCSVDVGALDLPPLSFDLGDGWRPGKGFPDAGVLISGHMLGRGQVSQWQIENEPGYLESLRELEPAVEELEPVVAGTREFSPRVAYSSTPGELWVGFRMSESQKEDDAIIAAAIACIEAAGLGECSGQSRGSGQVDLSFEVKDQMSSYQAVVRMFGESFSDTDFWVSDDYEDLFDE